MAGQAFFLVTGLPSEILLNVMKWMGVRDLTNFAMTNKRHCEIFKENQVTLMTNVLLGQPEFESILYIHTLGKIDFTHAMLYPRNIYFNPYREDGKIVHFTRFPVSFCEGKLICPRKIEFELQDLSVIWNMVKAIDWWVEEYPRLRWHQNPEDSRCLKAKEEKRLRKAISTWWLFADCFHNHWARYPYMPKLWQTDDRLRHIRRLSTIEIRELDSLWAVIESTVRRDVCTDMGPEEYNMPWGYYEGRSNNIVRTLMKINPGDLKAILEKRPRTNRTGIMQTARGLQQHLSADQEVLSATIDTVLQERLLLQCYSIDELPSSGILDEESYIGEDDTFRVDAWPSGNPPLSKQEIAMYPPEPTHPVPYGDDAHE
ncbi:hypothetical protein PG996_003389 [Apiospora saccharicola]|uniref:F-box domain-containing protein n=1 Tax=Apiospora saccharicola TaxID=335842 RepID=A0ABR1W148_9PEZI